ncbi:tol-pal system protein YbgF [Insolitispirillum peregrinum]|uniref:Cell division coordinator CpoB n=1 Tax=Insolitispirillum peregrinum TaxID=80876 RepID=A0A1N7IQN6_9PROT|nr:tol-pal system protein YbgF [Insolitispirillum peregrinum]SIS39405.1 tol-pal system protein YbgF [Insolitispirillum peregrinum]
MAQTASAVFLRHRFRGVLRSVRAAMLASCALTVLASGPAHAQQSNTIQSNLLVDQQNRIAELERLVQELTGRVEEAQFKNKQLTQRLDQLMGDMDFRFKQLEQGAAAQQSAAPPAAQQPAQAATSAQANGKQAPSGAQAGVLGYMGKDGSATAAAPAAAAGGKGSPLPAGSVADQYNYAFGLLRKNDYAGAETALKAFIAQNPGHELTGNAQYWLGETYYARADYKQAAVAFLDGYKNYPSSAKAADNLLKLGMTASQLGQTKQACAAFSKLATEYPQASDVLKRRAQAEKDRLRCS